MSKLLAVSWNSRSLRYVLADTQKRGAVRVLAAGEKPIDSDSADEAATQTSPVVERLREVVGELKAGKASLILCVSRGSVDSAVFTAPPATEAELPTLVHNMARRQLTGLGDEATIDYVSFPPADDGGRRISAMAMAASDEQLVHQMADASGCADAHALIVTHPLRTFAPSQEDDRQSASLIVSKGLQSAHILVVQHQRPVLSRTLRLAPGASRDDEARFVAGEIQRTILTIGDQLEQDTHITNAVLVGSALETSPLAGALEGRIDATVTQTSASELVTGDVVEAGQGAYAALIAAVLEAGAGTTAAVDFLHPKQPPTASGRWNRLIAIAAVLLLAIGSGWYYVHSMFAEWHTKIADLEPELEMMKENVANTASMRRQAAGLMRWERSRMSWLDELRDLTIRMPSSPELSVRQFAATPSRNGFTVTFQGTSRSPEAHRAMELGIQDRFHSTRTPSFSESRNGDNVVWNFRTTLQIRQRSRKDYKAHIGKETRKPEKNAAHSEAEEADRPKLNQASPSASESAPKSPEAQS